MRDHQNRKNGREFLDITGQKNASGGGERLQSSILVSILNPVRCYSQVMTRVGAILTLSAQSVVAQVPAEAVGFEAAGPSLEQKVTDLSHEVADLKALVLQLQQQLAKGSPPTASEAPAPVATASTPTGPAPVSAGPATTTPSLLPAGVTVNGLLDGYYEYCGRLTCGLSMDLTRFGGQFLTSLSVL